MKRRNKKKFSKRKIVRKVSKKNTSQEKESKIKLINVIRTSSGLEKDIKKIDKKALIFIFILYNKPTFSSL